MQSKVGGGAEWGGCVPVTLCLQKQAVPSVGGCLPTTGIPIPTCTIPAENFARVPCPTTFDETLRCCKHTLPWAPGLPFCGSPVSAKLSHWRTRGCGSPVPGELSPPSSSSSWPQLTLSSLTSTPMLVHFTLFDLGLSEFVIA